MSRQAPLPESGDKTEEKKRERPAKDKPSPLAISTDLVSNPAVYYVSNLSAGVAAVFLAGKVVILLVYVLRSLSLRP